MNILAVFAHPDDEVLACGGTLKKLSLAGHQITIAILGEGITSRYEKREDAETQKLNTLHECTEAAAKIMGATQLVHRNLPDNRFDSVDMLDVVKIVEDLVEETQPETIYTHQGSDLNVDHGVVHRAVLTATRPMRGQVVKNVLTCQIASSTEWSFQQFQPAFHPSVFVDISETLEAKIAAMEAYKSEARTFPHPRSPEALRAQAVNWGAAVGFDAAEAFQLVRSLNFPASP